MHYLNLMCDIETMSKKPNAAIVELGACFFTLDPKGGSKVLTETDLLPGYTHFNESISLSSNENYNRNIDSDTVVWWMNKIQTVKPNWLNCKKSLKFVLDDFYQWLDINIPDEIRSKPVNNKQFCIWSHGSCFDLPILQSALEQLRLFNVSHYKIDNNTQLRNNVWEPLWHYRNVRDTRTLFALADFDYEEYARQQNKEGEGAHTALADAICQANGVIAAFNKLHGIEV